MHVRSPKPLLVAVFSLFILFISTSIQAQENNGEKNEKLEPAKVILEHIGDGHEFHFATVGNTHFSIPLPVIVYSSGKGLSVFMSSAFHHGEEIHEGYRLLSEEFMKEHKLDEVKDASGQPLYQVDKIYLTDADGMPDPKQKVLDFSLTRNAAQMLISVILLIIIMTRIAKKYKAGQGVTSAPKGFQNAIEPVITFVRDEVGKPNLGHQYERFMPLLLTIFFFILINSLFGLIPGTANVAGNIAFTFILGVIAFIVIMFNTNKHYWAHIVNPPVPGFVKPIMIPVEILGIFTKPFALIIRLFANMVSGHIIILSFICLIFIFGAMNATLGFSTSPFFVLLVIFIYLIEILVAFIQAFIFANLTAVFIGQAFESGHSDIPGHEDAVVL